MKKIILIFTVLLTCNLYAQTEEDANKFANTISQDDLYDYLSILASDALEGRETGKRGQKMAAAFISNHFEEIGLAGPVKNNNGNEYYQPVILYAKTPGEIFVTVKDKKIENFNGVVYFGSANTGKSVDIEVVFAGNGTEEDFKQIDVKDKAVLLLAKNSRATRKQSELAKTNGAKLVFAISTESDEDFDTFSKQMSSFLTRGRLSVSKPDENSSVDGIFFVSPSVGESILGVGLEDLRKHSTAKLSKVKSKMVSVSIEQKAEVMETENVLGYLEGSDLKDELVVITAHYDHIGRRGEEINNGADDDGSGTSAVMELAQAFVEAKKEGKGPRRSILFMTVTGEEKGLLGSAYYAENPIFPLENTVVDLNIDMIGRVDDKHKDNPNYVYLVGSDRLSTELHDISEQVNKTYTQCELDYTYNDEDHPDRIYYRSDHWNFAKNNVPIIFYFNGVHDDYHQPSDTIEKINFEMLQKRTQLVFYTAWVLANRDQRPVVDKIKDTEINKN